MDAKEKSPWPWVVLGCVLIAAVVIALAVALPWSSPPPAPVAARTPGWSSVPAPSASEIDQQRDKYLKVEGPGHRGAEFLGLVSMLDMKAMSGKVFTEAEILDALGPPDRATRNATDAMLIYYHDDRAPRDGVVYISLSRTKTTFGYNAASVNAASDATVPLYVPTTKPAAP